MNSEIKIKLMTPIINVFVGNEGHYLFEEVRGWLDAGWL
jgi:hypothetical protein